MGRELNSHGRSLNRAQRYWLASVIPILVAIPFWWDTYYLRLDPVLRPYLATLAALATPWGVLSLLGVKPWQRIPRRIGALFAPPLAAAVTFLVIFGARNDSIYRWDGFTWGAGYITAAWCVFWSIKTFGQRPPTTRAKACTYGTIAALSLMQLFSENHLWKIFGPNNLPYWFASLLLITPVMLWLLRSSDYEDVAFVMASNRASAEAGFPASEFRDRAEQGQLNDCHRPDSR